MSEKKRNIYALIFEKIGSIGTRILNVQKTPEEQHGELQKLLEEIRELGHEAGGKVEEDAEALVDHIRQVLKHPNDDKLKRQMVESILRLRQDATEM